ncbi:WD40 repeat-like protein [Trichodelitschia bisporula]|uniref:methylated diphthine methylhydrolase n=1 Tax=Trichodelitschia bisporula TaxID=703511 RepID=A0A6G1I1C3_9PEZI|nr:WD40 repeat-like protein [Trichodelitschia bisporula]
MTSISSLTTLTTALPPSCISFWPLDKSYFVVGTYLLESNEDAATTDSPTTAPQSRRGSLDLFYLSADNTITLIQTLSTNYAIFDLAFRPTDPSSLGTATSTGLLTFFTLSASSPHPVLSLTLEIQVTDALLTSLAFPPASSPEAEAGLVLLTDSAGGVSVLSLAPRVEVEACKHDCEAWCAAFLELDKGILSGGDDAVLRYSSVEYGQVWANRRAHGAGVTAILPLEEGVVLSGSYDEQLRVLDVSPMGRGRVLGELGLGGGVWRLKLMRVEEDAWVVLAAVMHGGARVVRVQREGWAIEVLGRFEEHQSMCYGADWAESQGGIRIVSTSFYDRLVCFWRMEM